MTTSTATYSAVRPQSKALLPWLFAMSAQQWKAWQAARRAVRADELTWNMALQDARMMADLARHVGRCGQALKPGRGLRRPWVDPLPQATAPAVAFLWVASRDAIKKGACSASSF
nr:hypothetical protein [Comamonas jiangduensis]